MKAEAGGIVQLLVVRPSCTSRVCSRVCYSVVQVVYVTLLYKSCMLLCCTSRVCYSVVQVVYVTLLYKSCMLLCCTSRVCYSVVHVHVGHTSSYTVHVQSCRYSCTSYKPTDGEQQHSAVERCVWWWAAERNGAGGGGRVANACTVDILAICITGHECVVRR